MVEGKNLNNRKQDNHIHMTRTGVQNIQVNRRNIVAALACGHIYMRISFFKSKDEQRGTAASQWDGQTGKTDIQPDHNHKKISSSQATKCIWNSFYEPGLKNCNKIFLQQFRCHSFPSAALALDMQLACLYSLATLSAINGPTIATYSHKRMVSDFLLYRTLCCHCNSGGHKMEWPKGNCILAN